MNSRHPFQARREGSRRWRASLLSTALLISAGGMLAPSAIATTPDIGVATSSAIPTVDPIKESMRLRGEHGLDATETAVKAALRVRGLSVDARSTELQTAVNQWGFIGTPAEDREISRRESLVTRVEKDVPNLRSLPGFAGHFLDNKNGGKFIIQFEQGTAPASLAQKLSTVAALSGSTASDIQIREVKRSSADISTAIRAAWDSLGSQGATKDVSSIAENTKTNGLTIGLRSTTAKSRVGSLASKLGLPVAFTLEQGEDLACTSRTSCDSPRRGGVGITRSGSACSVGFVVVRSGVRGAVTAGHCWFGTNSGSVLSGTPTYGSLTSTNALTNGTHADMRWIAIPSGAQPWIYSTNSAMQNVVRGQALGTVGSSVCQFGRNSASPRCGTITSTNSSHVSSVTGYTVYGQSKGTFAAAGGDSGGAVSSSTAGTTARGTVSNGASGNVNYSSIGYTSTYNLGTLLTG